MKNQISKTTLPHARAWIVQKAPGLEKGHARAHDLVLKRNPYREDDSRFDGHARAQASTLEHGCDKHGKSVTSNQSFGRRSWSIFKGFGCRFEDFFSHLATLTLRKNVGSIGGKIEGSYSLTEAGEIRVNLFSALLLSSMDSFFHFSLSLTSLIFIFTMN